jgi:hypothetical protein
MGQIASSPTTAWSEYVTEHVHYDPATDVYRWIGSPSPPLGLVVPGNAWGAIIFPRLAPGVVSAWSDTGGGLAELGAYNGTTHVYGPNAIPAEPLPVPVDGDPRPEVLLEPAGPSPFLVALLAAAAARILLR